MALEEVNFTPKIQNYSLLKANRKRIKNTYDNNVKTLGPTKPQADKNALQLSEILITENQESSIQLFKNNASYINEAVMNRVSKIENKLEKMNNISLTKNVEKSKNKSIYSLY